MFFERQTDAKRSATESSSYQTQMSETKPATLNQLAPRTQTSKSNKVKAVGVYSTSGSLSV